MKDWTFIKNILLQFSKKILTNLLIKLQNNIYKFKNSYDKFSIFFKINKPIKKKQIFILFFHILEFQNKNLLLYLYDIKEYLNFQSLLLIQYLYLSNTPLTIFIWKIKSIIPFNYSRKGNRILLFWSIFSIKSLNIVSGENNVNKKIFHDFFLLE